MNGESSHGWTGRDMFRRGGGEEGGGVRVGGGGGQVSNDISRYKNPSGKDFSYFQMNRHTTKM